MATYFDHYAKEGNDVLHQIAAELDIPKDIRAAFRILRAVLHTLRDRIGIELSLLLLAQLPMALRALYVSSWSRAGQPLTYDTKDAFLSYAASEDRHFKTDFSNTGEIQVRAVFKILSMYVSPEMISALKEELPEDIACMIQSMPIADSANFKVTGTCQVVSG